VQDTGNSSAGNPAIVMAGLTVSPASTLAGSGIAGGTLVDGWTIRLGAGLELTVCSPDSTRAENPAHEDHQGGTDPDRG